MENEAGPVLACAALVRPLIAKAAEEGVDVEALFKALGLEADLIETRDHISLGDYFRLQNQISAALGDETLRFSTRQLLPGTTDFVMARLAGAGSLHEAMRVLAESYNLLHGGEFNTVRRKGDRVTFVIDDRRFPYTIDEPGFIHFSIECVQIFLHCILAIVSRPHAHTGLRSIAVTREARAIDSAHLGFWRAPIRYGAPVYMLDYDYEVATSPIVPPNKESLTAAAVYAEIVASAAASDAAGRSGEASAFVRQSLARGVIDQTRIAALAGVSVATLRRKLEAEGTSFRDMRRDVLNEEAKRLLRRRLSVSETAEQLGFSDFRAFNRAFKAWNGATPKSFLESIDKKAK